MTIVEWTPDLNTGIPDIDEQHKQMLHHINDFYEAANAKDKDRMSIVLFDLINSTLAHFQYEEALMEQAKYPLLEPHRRVHKNFIDKLMTLHEKLQTMETTDDIAVLLIDSLDGWLFRHIRINDKGYTNSVNESGVYQAMHENLVAARAAQMQEYGEVAEPEPQPKPAPQPVQPKPAPRPAPQAQARRRRTKRLGKRQLEILKILTPANKKRTQPWHTFTGRTTLKQASPTSTNNTAISSNA